LILFFLSSGLFLGWSLGANDAANVFGTAVGTRMVRFKTAALICSVFVVIGAVSGGAGAAHTLGKLGAVNALAGSFMVAFSAALTVFWMTKLRLPVSTSQAVVGAIIGWNFFTGSLTDYSSLSKIVSTWIVCPVLSALFAMILFKALQTIFTHVKLHLLEQDMYTRTGLLLVGAFGSYSLGANNIANVMGVFVPVSPFSDLDVYGLFTLSGSQQLFFLGGIAIAVGVYTYSQRVMETIGEGLLRLSPEAAFVVVLSQAMVLFIFSSEGLESWLINHSMPSFPLVPVSSSQAVVGAVIGIGIIRGGGKDIRFGVLREIATGWVTTPIIAGIITFVALFFLQNVFDQEVSRKTTYTISEPAIQALQTNENIHDKNLQEFLGKRYQNAIKFQTSLKRDTKLSDKELIQVLEYAEIDSFYIDPALIPHKIDPDWFTPKQIMAIKQLAGQSFSYKWELFNALSALSNKWDEKEAIPVNKNYNKEIKMKKQYILNTFQMSENLNAP